MDIEAYHTLEILLKCAACGEVIEPLAVDEGPLPSLNKPITLWFPQVCPKCGGKGA